MTIISLTENRKELVDAISSITGKKMRYQGPPTFAFSNDDFTVDRKGDLTVADFEKSVGTLKELATRQLIDDSWDEDRKVLQINLPISRHSVRSLTLLLQILWNKEELINKAIGAKAGFGISEDFIRNMREEPPASVSEFLFSWEEAGGVEITRGIEFSADKIHFTAFPYTEDPEWIKAYMDLATAIGNEAMNARRIAFAKPEVISEKYYFRVWLVRLGFDGKEYSTTRKKLLSNLSGHSAFRTKEQAALHKQKYGGKKNEEQKDEDKDVRVCPRFYRTC